MSRWFYALLVAVTVVLQVGFLPAWRPFGIVPDLLLAVIVVVAFEATASQTLLLAMVTGLALDLSSGSDFGLRLGFYTVVALGVALLNRLGATVDSVGLRVALAAVLALVANVVLVASLWIGGAALPVGPIALKTLGSAIMVGLLVMAINPLLHHYGARNEMMQFRGRRSA